VPLAYRFLEPRLAVAAQLVPDDVATLASAGFRSLICNRPDGEVPGQAPADGIEAVAASLGLAFRNIPVVGSAIAEADVEAYRRALDELPTPVLAYCRSGNRCTVLWALARAGHQPVDRLIDTASKAGYDLESWRPRLETRAGPVR